MPWGFFLSWSCDVCRLRATWWTLFLSCHSLCLLPPIQLIGFRQLSTKLQPGENQHIAQDCPHSFPRLHPPPKKNMPWEKGWWRPTTRGLYQGQTASFHYSEIKLLKCKGTSGESWIPTYKHAHEFSYPTHLFCSALALENLKPSFRQQDAYELLLPAFSGWTVQW